MTISRRLSARIQTAKSLLYERMVPNGVSAGYLDRDNFGDQLTAAFLSFVGLRALHCPRLGHATVLGVGSILHMVPSDYEGTILGSGLIAAHRAKPFPNATVLLARGALTVKSCEMGVNIPLGDPGILVDQMYVDQIADETRWRCGLVPHHVDISSGQGLSRFGRDEDGVHVIDVRNPPAKVIREISQCQCILSSSLHGLIVSDSIGIPNQWVDPEGHVIGGSFKYEDYFSSVSREVPLINIDSFAAIDSAISSAQCAASTPLRLCKQAVKDAVERFRDTIIETRTF